jgi:serine/threonine protein kinase
MKWLHWLRSPSGSLIIFRRMTFLDRLGLGGQGDVWLARDRLLRRLVTVKQVDRVDEDSSAAKLNSLQARVNAAHPAIPTVFAVIPDGSKTWLIGEYVKGVTLTELVEELSPESIYLIAKDLLSALSCLERLGLVHGDLSPANVVVDVNGQVRLLDFESCSRVGEPLSAEATYGFSAPERHERKISLPMVDTWSIGALIIWLITGEAPSVIHDDSDKAAGVEVNERFPRAEMLSDLLNLGVAAARADPELRPSANDLQHKLRLAYRWLEPVNRSNLAELVKQRAPKASPSRTVFDFPDVTERASSVNILQWVTPAVLMTLLALAFYQPAHSYSLDIRTGRISSATTLPPAFDNRWIANAFKTALPTTWTHTQATNSELISVDVHCDRGVCELIAEHSVGSKGCLHHSAVLDTSDDRVWRAALTELARALSIE